MSNSLTEHRCTIRMITYMAFISILLCPIAFLNINVLFFMINCWKRGGGILSILAILHKLVIYAFPTYLLGMSFWFQKLKKKKNALWLFTNMQYFANHSKWFSVSYLENAFDIVPLVGNEQTRNYQLTIVWATPCSKTWEAGRLWV